MAAQKAVLRINKNTEKVYFKNSLKLNCKIYKLK